MTESKNQTPGVRAFWNSRAGLGQAAGTRDLILKQLEIEAISKYVCEGMRVLDAGCGNGTTAIEIASRYNVHVVGFDFAKGMIKAAIAMAADADLKGSVNFQAGDIRNMPETLGKFDLVYTERVLINLPDWPTQRCAISDLTNLLVDDGMYVMCENSQDGLDKINLLRECVGLCRIEPPWHNRYLQDAEIEQCTIPGVRLEAIEYFTSTYYFLSRVVNAWLAAQEEKEPDYDAPVNQLALRLPPIGDLGQTRIWLWRRMSKIISPTQTNPS
jgi:SAM-dependent methyltransferase